MAVGSIARAMLAAVKIIFRRPLDVIGDHQIQPAIPVVIKPPGASGPSALVGHPGLGGDIGESAVAIVVVQDGAAVAGDVNVRVAVVVVVADGHALAVMSFAADPGFLCYVGERTIAVVMVERGAQGP